MKDKKIDSKETQELEKIINQVLDKRKRIMKNAKFRSDDNFGYIISEEHFLTITNH